MKLGVFTWMAVGSLALVMACGGTAEIGGGCDTSGAIDECVEGAICTGEGADGASCRKLCVEQTDCADTENCNGINDSSQKSCQPK